MTGPAGEITLGVEEEFHIVDLRTRQLVSKSGLLLDMLPTDRFTKELQRSTVEANSKPCAQLADLGRDLGRMRETLITTAAEVGLGIVAAGSVPLADLEQMKVSPDARYEQMLDDYQMLTREQLICGTQVHAQVTDPDLAIAVAHRLTPYLPPLLALSSSSPYWLGTDTGYASYRTLVWQRWPTAGPMAKFASAADYKRMIQELIRSGVISDPGMIYYDVRPSSHVPTVELRVCDSCPRVDDIVLIAGLFRALVARELAEVHRDPDHEVQLEPVRAATWQAARSGLEGELVDPVEGTPAPAAQVVTRLVESLRPYLEECSDYEFVSGLAADAVARGSSAGRQRRAFAARGELTDVVDLLLAETRPGEWGTGHHRPPAA